MTSLIQSQAYSESSTFTYQTVVAHRVTRAHILEVIQVDTVVGSVDSFGVTGSHLIMLSCTLPEEITSNTSLERSSVSTVGTTSFFRLLSECESFSLPVQLVPSSDHSTSAHTTSG